MSFARGYGYEKKESSYQNFLSLDIWTK